MMPQMHDNKKRGEEQLPSPVENKQMATPLEKRTELTRTRIVRRGAIISMVGGMLTFWGYFPVPEEEIRTGKKHRVYVLPNHVESQGTKPWSQVGSQAGGLPQQGSATIYGGGYPTRMALVCWLLIFPQASKIPKTTNYR